MARIGKQTHNTLAYKTKSKNSLKLFSWEKKYQHTLHHFTPKTTHPDSSKISDNKTNSLSDSFHKKTLSSSFIHEEGAFSHKVNSNKTSTRLKSKKFLSPLKSKLNDSENANCTTSAICLSVLNKLKSENNRSCIQNSPHLLNYLISLPDSFKSERDRFVGDNRGAMYSHSHFIKGKKFLKDEPLLDELIHCIKD